MNPQLDSPTENDEASEWLPTRASLLERLRQWSDNASWQEFFDTYWKLIFRTARATGLKPNDAEEVVQETMIEVARQMPDFRYRPPAEGGSFKQWLRNQTKWRIVDQLRRNQRHAGLSPLDPKTNEPTDGVALESLSSSMDAKWDREWEVTMVEAALQRLKRRVDTRQYQVFYLLEQKEWSAGEVARQLGLSRPAVYTIRFRLRKQFRTILDEMKLEP